MKRGFKKGTFEVVLREAFIPRCSFPGPLSPLWLPEAWYTNVFLRIPGVNVYERQQEIVFTEKEKRKAKKCYGHIRKECLLFSYLTDAFIALISALLSR